MVSALERVMGIEPTRPAWKAGILPLNYTRRTFCIISQRLAFVNSFFKIFVKYGFLPILIFCNI